MKKIIAMFFLVVFCMFSANDSFANKNMVSAYTALNQLKKSLLAQQEYEKAVGFLNEFIADNKGSYFADMALVEVGTIYLNYIKDYHQALKCFVTVVRNNRKPELTKQVIKKIKVCQQKLTELEIDSIEMALEDYYLKKVAYPAKLAEAFTTQNKGMLKDSWGTAYIYELLPVDFLPGMNNQGFLLLSLGADKMRGTQDDIVVTSSYENKAITKYIEQEEALPFVLKHVFRYKNYLGAMLVYQKNGQKKMMKVVPGDEAAGYKVISIGAEGIILYSADEEIVFIPVES